MTARGAGADAGGERRILVVAYHYPPIQGSSGVHRTLSFTRALAQAGWWPTVLTVTRNALTEYRDENEAMVPPGVEVRRALAFDTMRHLTIAGKYPGFLAIPDRWVSWTPAAVATALAWCALRRPRVIYSTYPIASAHLVGYLTHRLTGIPWIADFRDPMAQEDYPRDRRMWRAFRWIERKAVTHASRLLFTAPGALEYYEAGYGAAVTERGAVIENGYEEAMFDDAERALTAGASARSGPIRLIHAGVLYPEERDPRAFFRALGRLKAAGRISADTLVVSLRGSAHEDLYRGMLADMGIDDIVHLDPAVGYVEALQEMLTADGLLLFQSSGCNFQIPAKTYEYFRARRPILAFTDPAGDTAGVLRAGGVEWIAAMDSDEAIERVLRDALDRIEENRDGAFGSEAFARTCARESRAGEFVRLVDDVAGASV